MSSVRAETSSPGFENYIRGGCGFTAAIDDIKFDRRAWFEPATLSKGRRLGTEAVTATKQFTRSPGLASLFWVPIREDTLPLRSRVQPLFREHQQKQRSPPPARSSVSDRLRHVLVVEVQRHLCVLHHFDPPRVGRGGGVFIVPVPPLVRWSLRVACRRVLPLLLAPERRYV